MTSERFPSLIFDKGKPCERVYLQIVWSSRKSIRLTFSLLFEFMFVTSVSSNLTTTVTDWT